MPKAETRRVLRELAAIGDLGAGAGGEAAASDAAVAAAARRAAAVRAAWPKQDPRCLGEGELDAREEQGGENRRVVKRARG